MVGDRLPAEREPVIERQPPDVREAIIALEV
jgi:hypothetical protein